VIDAVTTVTAPEAETAALLSKLGVPITRITSDSRRVRPGDVFAAYRGSHQDGRRFIADAIDRGAGAIVWDVEGFSWNREWKLPHLPVDHLQTRLGIIADLVYGHPSRELWVVGVTGTNGKTTTVELLGAIFRAAGRPVVVAGNVGRPLTSVEPAEWVVCELSSFQLEDVHELACEIAVLLNLEPDHLDRHGTFEAYREAKLRIFERAETAVVPRGLGLPGIEFSRDDDLPAEPRIPGAHNRENAAAATAAARAAGIADGAIGQALQDFPGVEHRLELVAEIDGVRYVNDSKATNTAAARRALVAFDAPLRVILGGSLKGEDFATLADAVRESARAAYLIGEAADELDNVLRPGGVTLVRCGDLATAVERAAADAQPGDIVLLSPACASFDQFRDFEERGEEFRRLVQKLKG
jgi:UDP-N-acetylmuramoylalanine--D-glutamate ligase